MEMCVSFITDAKNVGNGKDEKEKVGYNSII